jgi:hypothetical protein
MARRSVAALTVTALVALLASLTGFRRSFQKIPESADLPFFPRLGLWLYGHAFRMSFAAIT